MRRIFYAAVCLALLLGCSPVISAPYPVISQDVGVCDPYNPQNCARPDSSGNLPVTGTFSATLGGFAPGLTFATLTATASSASVALPAGVVVAFQNTGTTTVSCTLGVGSATATANQIQVPASSTVFVTPGANTFGACIDQTGSTSNVIVLAGGSGLGTGFGGGGGGAGGSSAIATWAGGTLGAMANYGTTPGAVLVPGMNAFVTNTVTANATLSAETTKVIGTVRGVGNVGGVFDAIGQNVAAPANWLQAGCQFNTTPATITTGNGSPCQLDSAGNLLVNVKVSALPSGAATAANQATEISSLATIAANSSTPVPPCAAAPCVTTIGNVGFDPSSRSPLSIPINISTATTTQLIAASGSTVIYVTSFDVIAGGTGNITFQSADTGGACANPVPLTGAYPLTAQAGIAKGNGVGAVLKLPSGKALCALTSAAVQMSGSLSAMQF